MAPGFKGAVTSLKTLFLLWYLHINEAQSSGGCTHERVILTSKTGTITVGNSGPTYNNFARCEWLIKGDARTFIQLDFSRIETECSFDYVFVYDGDTYNSTKLASVSGDTLPKSLVAKSGRMLVLMFSDRNFKKWGFLANYSITDCPFGCHGHGVCTNNSCVCDIDYTGESCEHDLCPKNCSAKGLCIKSGDRSLWGCNCSLGYAGYACDMALQGEEDKLKWVTLLPSVTEFTDRFDHTAGFLESSECVYVFGGNAQNSVLDDLLRFCFTESKWEVIHKIEPWPSARYDHNMVVYNEGLFVFGGILVDGSHSNELWFFDTVSGNWSLLNFNNSSQPPGLSGHSMTLADDIIYIIGGKKTNGQYSSDVYSINASNPQSWSLVKLAGGRAHSRLLHGHSAVYHPESSSIIIYGGIAVRSVRYTTLSKKMFVFNIAYKFWTEIEYTSNMEPGLAWVPQERSQHTALIMGNYMIIYGGYVHIHASEEKCYDEGIYLYHLGCHQFVNHSLVHQGTSYKSMPKKGRFGHSAVGIHGNIMVIIGGFSGYPHGDVIAYKFPGVVAPPNSEISQDKDYCMNNYSDNMPYTCYDNLECIICKNRTDIKRPGCVHRTRSEMCYRDELSALPYHCQGICSHLKTCQACLLQGQGVKLTTASPRRRFYQVECSWCVKNSTCQQKAVPEGSCQRADNTASGIIGWWNSSSPSWTDIAQCSLAEVPGGIQKASFYHPRNNSQPDEVEFVGELSATGIKVPIHYLQSQEGDPLYVSFHGYIWPLEVPPVKGMNDLTMYLESINAYTLMFLSNDSSIQNAELVKNMTSSSSKQILDMGRKGNTPLFPSTARDRKYYFLLEAKSNIKVNATVAVKWNAGIGLNQNSIQIYTEFLEMFHSDACSNYTNCMACMMDASCGWCPSNSQCVRKAANQTASTGWCGPDLDKLLITHPKDCYTCPDYTDCTDCSQDPLCEWKRVDEQCHRRGRFASNTVTDPSQCREPCDEKKNCSSCISERNECFWCETTKTCFPFNHYSSHFIHGKCQDWVDFEGKQTHYCLDCSSLPNCTACLERFGCGWCGDYNNPKIGKCVGGGFPGPSDGSCDSIVSSHSLVTNQTFSGHTNWTYHQCLDADECRLGLHKCHEKAECINTEGPEDSYECLCEQGYMGNGTHCRETCYHNCVNGTCSGAPNYQCVCNLGWTGLDCGTDCGCNFHSTCQNGVGICDKCQDSTDGQFCEKCQFGYYGNPKEGCHKCSCNQHGDASKGICNNVTGECYCTGNTEGLVCQHCSPGHYGSPVNGGKCYRACQGRLVLEQAEGSLGVQLPVSATSNKNLHCLWIIHAPDTAQPSDGFTVTVDGIATRCRENHLMVFDGVPPFISGNTTESRLLGTFCGQAQNLEPIRTDTDTVTVYFEMDMDNKDIYVEQKGFNLSYVINLCRRCKENEICVGNQCKQDPNRSSASKFYNVCPTSCDTKSHGTCVCINDLDMMVFPWNFLEPISKRKPGSIPGRYGHSVTSCGENFFYVFGGYSQEHGALNDIWKYTTSTYQWTQEQPITSDQPDGRYFHQAVCSPVSQEIYVYGGIVKNKAGAFEATNEFWKFSTGARVWTRLDVPEDFNPVAGHTMTLVKERYLVVIGGISSKRYFSSDVYIYNIIDEDNQPAWSRNNHTYLPLGLYGHSAVYDPDTDMIYIHGGMAFKQFKFDVSNDTFMYDTEKKQAYLVHVQGPEQAIPRVFHVAVRALEGMLVIGGMGNLGQTTEHMSLFRFNCSTWHKYLSKKPTSETYRSRTNSLIAASSIRLKDRVYVVGGYDGTTYSEVVVISPKETFCQTAGTQMDCLQTTGCDFCVAEGIGKCVEKASDSTCSGGQACDVSWINQTVCSTYQTCQTCMTKHPHFLSPCKWFIDGPSSSCINSELPIGFSCKGYQECSFSQCTDCLQNEACSWTNCIQQGDDNFPIVDTRFSSTWRCAKNAVGGVCTNHSVCPKRCDEYSDCESCQRASGTGAGSSGCVWSSIKQQCFDKALIKLYCVGGECGVILEGKPHKCPVPCSQYQICAECIKAPWCGWCAFAGYIGEGICMQGGRDNPTGVGSCLEDDIKQSEGYRPINLWTKKSKGAPIWAYTSCPPENECVNTHHDCDNESQDCTDTETSYNCTCKIGYLEDAVSGKCKPHCHKKCMNGTCIRPDRCQCNFGYVGDQCEKECKCNGNSNCPNELGLTDCLKCMNHTKGRQCSLCKSRFVGDPTERKPCVSCFVHCNNHTAACLSMTDYSNRTFMALFRGNNSMLDDPILNGTKPSDAVCVGCKNNTMGARCDRCQEGYFRVKKEGKTLVDACIKCQCNGHSDTCKNETGEGCQCLNNTETPACKSNSDPNDYKCWQKQCSKCKEYFIGDPTNGHHCYRQMTVDKEYCFDPDTQTNCNQNPGALLRGRTVFFAVQPRYLNVDIRITIDVTLGAADVYFSSSEKTFTVNVQNMGIHAVELDSEFTTPPPSLQSRFRSRRSIFNSTSNTSHPHITLEATNFHTYHTVQETGAILMFKNVRSRLVVTLPLDQHDLRTSKFYLIIYGQGNGRGGGTYGNLYFRQDQPHIDLFVFFSVFFSCFFLFLAMCVLLWKFKQAIDTQRSRQRQQKEMLHMASRPFAKVLVLIEPDSYVFSSTPVPRRRTKYSKVTSRNAHHLPTLTPVETNLPPLTIHKPIFIKAPVSPFDIVPIATEPTADNMVSLRTVVIQLPGDQSAPSKLCLGTGLTLQSSRTMNTGHQKSGARQRNGHHNC